MSGLGKLETAGPNDAGLVARVLTLENVCNALAEYATEMSRHYNQRVSHLELLVVGTNRPEPYFPSFNEWYQKRDAEMNSPKVAAGLSQVERREAQGMAQSYRG